VNGLKREATITWLGHPPAGAPRLTVGSHSIAPALPLNFDLNATHPLATSSGELLAGALGSVFVWFVADQLVADGTQATELVAVVTLRLDDAKDGTDVGLSAIACQLSVRVAGVEEAHLDAVAQAAMTRCMATLGMRTERIDVTVDASLKGG
jgi:organic hydroperoxide reductase OsmC/OhrA